MKGYQQLESIAQVLEDLPTPLLTPDKYLDLLRSRVEWVLTKNRTVAADLKQAYQLLLAVARGLHYPPARSDRAADPKPNRQTVAEEIIRLRQMLNTILAHHTGQPIEQIEKDTDRDRFMSSHEAVAYGLADKVLDRMPQIKRA